ncbi:hypothetical protein BDR07DRAFT_1394772 [Suillus spraguei]|nr:hypothetical protein BDR07DRAFT_1394772 [Suillus spraguei]
MDISLSWGLQFTTYIYVSMTTFWCYDYICSLHEEWTYLLRSDWSMLKGLYIIIRYLPFSLLAIILCMSFDPNETPDRCSVLTSIISGLGIALVFFSECFFMLRTYVLWNKNRILLAAMLITFFVFLALSLGFAITYTAPATYAYDLMPGVTTPCYQDPTTLGFFVTFNLLTAFELGLMILTLIRAIQSWRMTSSRLYVVLVKHNIFYYACALLLSVVNVVTSVFFMPSYYNMLYVFEVTILTILATRMHLDLWQTNRRTHGSGAVVGILISGVSSVNVTV